MYYLIFDTETTGFNAKNRLVQLAWELYHDETLLEANNLIVKPHKFTIPGDVVRIHGISTQYALEHGLPLRQVLETFLNPLEKADFLIGHNIDYDIMVLSSEYSRLKIISPILLKPRICTMKASVNYVKIPGANLSSEYKYPKLAELYRFLFGKQMPKAHNAKYDVRATAQCFFELKKRGVIKIRNHKNL